MAEEDIFAEIKRDISAARWQKLWELYGSWLIGACVALIVVTAAQSGWNYYKTKQMERRTDALLTAISAPSGSVVSFDPAIANHEDALTALALLRKLPARATAADITVTVPENATEFDSAVWGPLLALIRHRALLEQKNPYPPNTAALKQGSAFYHSARELAGWSALDAGQKEQAREHFTLLANDATTPAAMRERAQAALGQME